MDKYCEKCGNKLCDGGDACLKCGHLVNVDIKKIKRNNNLSTVIFPVIIVPMIIVFFTFLPFLLIFGVWIYSDFEYSRECKSEYGKNYHLVHGDEVKDGYGSGHYCCVRGKSKNTDYCEFVGW